VSPAVARVSTAVGLWLLLARVALAQGRPVQGRPAGPETLEAQPRQVVATAFRVTNNSPRRRELAAQVKLPKGWKLITTEFPFRLEPGRSDARLVSFLVPRTALAGRYPVTYRVQDRTIPSLSDQWTIHVVVLPVAKLMAKVMQAPKTVIAGEPYKASFIVANQGNVDIEVRFSAQVGDRLEAFLDTEACVLGASKSRVVTVTVKTRRELKKSVTESLRFVATAPKAGKKGLKARATCLFEIIPRISTTEDPYLRLPVELTFRSAVTDRDGSRSSGFQMELAGGGPIDEEGTQFIDFLFRGPDISERSIYGARDECRFSYWNQKYALHFGDRVYSLTPLTEFFRYARGAEARVNLGRLTLGGYYAETRWQEPEERQAAAYAQYQLNPNALLSLSYLRKRADDGPSPAFALGPPEGQMLSLRGQFKPLPGMDVDLEYALGENESPGRRGDDDAYRVEVRGEFRRVAYYFEFIHAGPACPGYYTDMEYLSGGFAAPICGSLRIHADYRREKDNLDLNPALGTAPLDTYRRVGLDYRFPAGTYVSLDYENRERKDRLAPPQFDAEEHTVGLTVAHQFTRLSFMAAAEVGSMRDRLTGGSHGIQEYRLSGHFTASPSQSYSAYVEYRQDGGLGDEKSRHITGGANATWRLASHTVLSLDARRSDYHAGADGSRDILEIRLLRIFKGGRRLTVSARRTAWRGADSGSENALFLEYSIPLGVPLARRKSVGAVKGRVYDEETGRGIANTVVRLNGATAVTDSSGNYIFPAVRPGAYYLALDASQLAIEKMPTRASQQRVTVVGGQDAVVNVGFARGAVVAGRVALFRPKDDEPPPVVSGTPGTTPPSNGNGAGGGRNGEGNGLVEAGGIPNVFLELSSDSEVLRAVSDARGHFSFGNVRPGKWVLKAHAAKLPEHHRMEKDTFELELRPGETRSVVIRVVPKRRPVRIIREGGVLREERGAPK